MSSSSSSRNQESPSPPPPPQQEQQQPSPTNTTTTTNKKQKKAVSSSEQIPTPHAPIIPNTNVNAAQQQQQQMQQMNQMMAAGNNNIMPGGSGGNNMMPGQMMQMMPGGGGNNMPGGGQMAMPMMMPGMMPFVPQQQPVAATTQPQQPTQQQQTQPPAAMLPFIPVPVVQQQQQQQMQMIPSYNDPPSPSFWRPLSRVQIRDMLTELSQIIRADPGAMYRDAMVFSPLLNLLTDAISNPTKYTGTDVVSKATAAAAAAAAKAGGGSRGGASGNKKKRKRTSVVASADGSNDDNNNRSAADKFWNDRYLELKEYHAIKGDCNVPYNYAPNKQLGRWVSNQKEEKKKLDADAGSGGNNNGKRQRKSNLTQERLAKLNALNFTWDSRLGLAVRPSDVATWELRLKDLKQFKKKFGHTVVPNKRRENNALSSWVLKQRQEKKRFEKGQQTAMTQEKIDRLNEIGFCWDPFGDKWENYFSQVEDFQQKNGHCNIKSKHPTLGSWVMNQRMWYRKFKNREKTRITQERIDRLSALGFVWNSVDTNNNNNINKTNNHHHHTQAAMAMPMSPMVPTTTTTTMMMGGGHHHHHHDQQQQMMNPGVGVGGAGVEDGIAVDGNEQQQQQQQQPELFDRLV